MKNILSELPADLLETKIEYKKINLLFLSQVVIGDMYIGLYKPFTVINLVKKFGLENLLKFFTFKFSNPFSRKSPRTQFDYLFVNEVNNAGVIEALNLSRRQFATENTGVVFSDARLEKQDERSINIFNFATYGTLLKSGFDFMKILPVLYKHRGEINAIGRKFNMSKLFIVLNCFDSIFLVNCVSNLFLKLQASKIVMMTDVHKLSRIVSIISKGFNTRTFVIQHAATVGEAGYLPIISDKMLVWGEGSQNWFIERDQPVDKLQIVGSPRMDTTFYEKVELDKVFKPRWNKVLIIMSEEIIEEDFLIKIRDAFITAAISDLEIIIKLHPGKSVDYSFIPEGVFHKSGLTYKIYRYEDTKTLIKEADVIFVTTSSVGMEAIIHNKPIFQFKSRKHHNNKMSYEDFDCSHIFETSDQLTPMILNSEQVFSKLKNYAPFVTYYFGTLDGGSAKRIKEYIVNY